MYLNNFYFNDFENVYLQTTFMLMLMLSNVTQKSVLPPSRGMKNETDSI